MMIPRPVDANELRGNNRFSETVESSSCKEMIDTLLVVASFRALTSLSFEPCFSLCRYVNFRFRRTFNDVVFKVLLFSHFLQELKYRFGAVAIQQFNNKVESTLVEQT